MSFIIADYTTLGDYLESQRSLRSPTLRRSTPNFDTLDTPPLLVDVPEDYETAYATFKDGQTTHRQIPKRRSQPSASKTLLVEGLGPQYPSDIADRAGAELFLDSRDSSFEDKTPDVFDDHNSMFHLKVDQGGSSLSDQWLAQQALTASRHASEKLNDALIPRQSTLAMHSQIVPPNVPAHRSDVHLHERRPKQRSNISISSLTSDDTTNNLTVSHLKIALSPTKHKFDARPSSRPTISSLQIDTSSHLPNRQCHNSISSSPALAPFAIDASDRYTPQTLPKLHRHDSPSSATPHDCRQTLPSLEAALTSAIDSNGTPFSDTPTVLARLSPNQHSSHYGLSPGLFSQAASMPSLSPPRLSSNPEAWRTHSHNSQNSSNSGVSEHGSGYSSNTFSTPATRPSPPPSSSATSQYPGSDHDSIPDSDSGRGRTDSIDPMDGQSQYIFDGTGHVCTYPGCTAAPFQTQYLLHSHQNVHSNQRPHFCPVEGCPRGPGGQGFKRKNEMIRHGLVHQSPGYVCPFCPDQQHKYPRPDNLQRHVRVHHIERDRDDPLLREVLAQRAEGGSRGRRRRLGG